MIQKVKDIRKIGHSIRALIAFTLALTFLRWKAR